MALKPSRPASTTVNPTSGPASRMAFSSVSATVGALLIIRAQNRAPLLSAAFSWPYRARTGEAYTSANAVLLPELAANTGTTGGSDAFVGRGDAFAMGYEKAPAPILVTGTFHGFIDMKKLKKNENGEDAQSDEPQDDTDAPRKVRVLRTFEVAVGASVGMKDSSAIAIPHPIHHGAIVPALLSVEPELYKDPITMALAYSLVARVACPSALGNYPNKEDVAEQRLSLGKASVWSEAAKIAKATLESLGVSLDRTPVAHDNTKALARDKERENYRAARAEYREAKKAALAQGQQPKVAAPDRIVFTDW